MEFVIIWYEVCVYKSSNQKLRYAKLGINLKDGNQTDIACDVGQFSWKTISEFIE
jgi:hypothetical protein